MMKLVLFRLPSSEALRPGLLTEGGVVDITDLVRAGHAPQLTMQLLIDDFGSLKPALEAAARDRAPLALAAVRLGPPLPRPGKILNAIGNYQGQDSTHHDAVRRYRPQTILRPTTN